MSKRRHQESAAGNAEKPLPFAYPRRTRRIFFFIFLSAFALGTFLRFYDLERKPLHHDEGVNAFFLLNLQKDFPSGWKYDPENYHGPFLFLTDIVPVALSDTAFAMRFNVALVGSLLVWLIWPLRKRIGYAAAAAFAFLIATSPSFLFFSRTNIHEIFLAFFTLGTVTAAVRFQETRRPVFLFLAAASWAGVVTNKETYIMTAAAFVAALAFCWFYFSRRPRLGEIKPREVFRSLWTWVGKHPFIAAGAVALFLFLVAVYYSSLFTNLKGTTSDLVNSLLIWRKTGTKGAGHEKPWLYFLQLLWRFELPILAFGLAGAFYAFARRNVFMIFTALWAALLTLIYSSVPYKTPWLALNFVLPLAVLAGGFFENVYRRCAGNRGALVGIAAGFVVVNGAWLAGKTWKVNFVEYDDDRNMIVYSQTRRDVYDLLEALDGYAAGQQGLNTQINIITDEYWPLNWYLHNYEHTAYWGRVIPDPDAPIVIGRARTQAELEKTLQDTYVSEMYSLRPGVDLILYLRQHKGKTPEEELKGDRPLAEVPADLAPGLAASYYNKISPVGEPVRRTVESDIYFRLNNDEEKVGRLGLKAPLSIVWEGLILIPSDGTYYFATESDDGSWVFVDDKLVVDNGGNHGNQYVSGEIELAAGYHRFRVKYFDSAWGAWMRLLWTPPGGAEAPIPADRLLHSKEDEG